MYSGYAENITWRLKEKFLFKHTLPLLVPGGRNMDENEDNNLNGLQFAFRPSHSFDELSVDSQTVRAINSSADSISEGDILTIDMVRRAREISAWTPPQPYPESSIDSLTNTTYDTPSIPETPREYPPAPNYRPRPLRRRIMTQNKNKKHLDSFIKYCTEHPQERFFQCLRNWAKEVINPRIQYFLTAEYSAGSPTGFTNLTDTFYWD